MIGIFTTYNAEPSNPNMYEFVEKNLLFLEELDQDLAIISFTHQHDNGNGTKYFNYFKNLSKANVTHIQIDISHIIDRFLSEQKIDKLIQELNIEELNQLDSIFTFGNFVTFQLNNDKNKNNLTFNDLVKYNLDLSLPYYLPYKVANGVFQQLDCKKIQFYSDPLDLPMKGFKQGTPDSTENTHFEAFLPLYQHYYYNLNKSSNNASKNNIFVMGNTCGDEYRKYLFDRYVLAFYEQHKEDERFKFYACGYKNYKIVLDNFIDHNLFYSQIESSRCGLVLNTYSKDFVSANKIAMMLSRNCLPIITTGGDSKSNYIPQQFKQFIEVNDSIELYMLVDEIEKNPKKYENIVEDMRSYYDLDYSKIIKGVFE